MSDHEEISEQSQTEGIAAVASVAREIAERAADEIAELTARISEIEARLSAITRKIGGSL